MNSKNGRKSGIIVPRHYRILRYVIFFTLHNLKKKTITASVAIAQNEQQGKTGPPPKKLSLIQTVATAPIIGIQKVFDGVGKLKIGGVELSKDILNKYLEYVLQRLKKMNMSIDDIAETIKCVIVKPQQLTECF